MLTDVVHDSFVKEPVKRQHRVCTLSSALRRFYALEAEGKVTHLCKHASSLALEENLLMKYIWNTLALSAGPTIRKYESTGWISHSLNAGHSVHLIVDVDCLKSCLGNRLGCEGLSAVDTMCQLSAWVSLWTYIKSGPRMSPAIHFFLLLKMSWQSAM